jgi:hypothetical protein
MGVILCAAALSSSSAHCIQTTITARPAVAYGTTVLQLSGIIISSFLLNLDGLYVFSSPHSSPDYVYAVCYESCLSPMQSRPLGGPIGAKDNAKQALYVHIMCTKVAKATGHTFELQRQTSPSVAWHQLSACL